MQLHWLISLIGWLVCLSGPSVFYVVFAGAFSLITLPGYSVVRGSTKSGLDLITLLWLPAAVYRMIYFQIIYTSVL